MNMLITAAEMLLFVVQISFAAFLKARGRFQHAAE